MRSLIAPGAREDDMADKLMERDVETRALAPGVGVATQGEDTRQTPAAPPRPYPPAATVDTVTIILIDRRSLVTPSMQTSLRARLERDLNALGVLGNEPDTFAKNGLRIAVRWESKVPSAAQRARYGKFDFPLYFEKAHTSDSISPSNVTAIMREHGIRNAGQGVQQYSQAEDGWKSKDVEGLGIQPLQGYRKVGFLKYDQVSSRANDVETAFANVLKHEFGHMCNILKHSTAGIMLASVPISNAKVAFTEEDQRAIQHELMRLKLQSETTMQRIYEQRNR